MKHYCAWRLACFPGKTPRINLSYIPTCAGEVHSFRVPEVDAEDIAISEGIRFQAHSDLVTDMLVLFPPGLFSLQNLASVVPTDCIGRVLPGNAHLFEAN